MAIRSIRLPYLAEPIGKKDGFVVMFPDGTGEAYILKALPPEIQYPDKRLEFFAANSIKPSIRFEVIEGLLQPSILIQSDLANKAVSKIATTVDVIGGKYQISYLLAHRYLQPEHAIAMVAGSLIDDVINSEQAVAIANRAYAEYKDQERESRYRAIGLTETKVLRYLTATSTTVDVKATVTDLEPKRQSRKTAVA
jgi:hypothetical protein